MLDGEKVPGSEVEEKIVTEVVEAPVVETTEDKGIDAEEPKGPAFPKDLHKHPRFRRVIDENKALKQEMAQFKQFMEEQKNARQAEPVKQSVSQVPPEYQKIFGDDVEAYQSWEKMLDSRAEQRAKAVFEEIKKQEESAKRIDEERNQKAVQYALNELSELSDETGLDLTNEKDTVRNQILDIIAKYNVLTPEGYPNIRAAYELHQKLYPSSNAELEQKKNIVSKTMKKTNSKPESAEVFTPKKLKEIEQRGGLRYIMGLK